MISRSSSWCAPVKAWPMSRGSSTGQSWHYQAIFAVVLGALAEQIAPSPTEYLDTRFYRR